MKTEENKKSSAVIRLNSLMKSGYQINEKISQQVENALWLKHPSDTRFRESELILYDDGMLVHHDPIKDQNYELRINASDTLRFSQFLQSVPVPTFGEKIQKSVTSTLVWVTFTVIVTTISGLIGYIFKYWF